jgi:hypothetical protein
MNREKTEVNARPLKVKFQLKVAAFILSIVSLSWFFEGMRQMKESTSLGHVALLMVAAVVTLALLWVQAFWIYLEEKSKGTLKKQVAHFDNLENWLKTAGAHDDKDGGS